MTKQIKTTIFVYAKPRDPDLSPAEYSDDMFEYAFRTTETNYPDDGEVLIHKMPIAYVAPPHEEVIPKCLEALETVEQKEKDYLAYRLSMIEKTRDQLKRITFEGELE